MYCKGISLGLYLDLEYEDIKADLRSFTNDAAQIYINYQTISLFSEAVAYTRKWTEEGKKLSNPNYNRYDSDCTNFISQVLAENRVAQVQGSRKDDSSWYYEWGIIARPSYTWAGAHNLYMHLRDYSSNIKRITSTAGLKVGDIISFDTNSNDDTFHIGHTVVITKKEGNSWDKIYLTYHSTDREDYPASNLINAGYIPYGWTIN